jgi:hypothetical protein
MHVMMATHREQDSYRDASSSNSNRVAIQSFRDCIAVQQVLFALVRGAHTLRSGAGAWRPTAVEAVPDPQAQRVARPESLTRGVSDANGEEMSCDETRTMST